jgi:hypothetical protein
MLGTYTDTRSLPWPVALPRRRTLPRVSLGPAGRGALRQGLRGAIQTTCLSAAVLAAAGAVGASRGPVVLSEPQQSAAQQVVVQGVLHPATEAARVQTR